MDQYNSHHPPPNHLDLQSRQDQHMREPNATGSPELKPSNYESQIQMNPDVASPTRIRWMDAFIRVRQQLNEVRLNEGKCSSKFSKCFYKILCKIFW